MQERENGESERCFVMKQIGVATLLHAKAGRLPLGLLLRENLIKLSKEKSSKLAVKAV
jgi:hypothetical protein